LLQITSHGSVGKPTIGNYELQHRNNPRRYRDTLRPAHLRHRRAARAGRSHPARAGDYFRRKIWGSRLNSELRKSSRAGVLASTAFNIPTGHRQRLGSGIISRSGESRRAYVLPGLLLNVHKIRVDSDNKR
jgi:hypothetical protein